jgi:hypothetical protein
MRLRRYIPALWAACFVAGCARVGLPPGRERVEDDEPPRLKKVSTVDANHVEVYFSEGMDEKTLRAKENYAVVGEDGEPLAVDAAVVVRPDMVSLVTDAQEAGIEYTLVARNVADASGGNRIESGNVKTFKGSKDADEKPPAVVGTFPADGATAVGLYPEISVEFTDVMAADADVSAVVELRDDFGTDVPVEGAFEGHFLRFRPGRPLDYATKYTCVVKDDCTDIAGNSLYRENRSSFVTLEDREEVKISGRVRVLEEGVAPAGVEVRLALSPDPLAEGARVVGYARAGDDGAFDMPGVPPNSESKATYYLVSTLDEDGDGAYELVGGYNYSGGKAAALPTLLGGTKLENVEVVLSRADVTGPTVENAYLSPDPTDGQRGCYVHASFVDGEDSPIAEAEVFFDEAWSDGTGLALFPVGAAWSASATAAGERYVLDMRRHGVKKEGRHVAYFHGRDDAGNWGEFYELPFEVTGPPKPARRIEGTVWFEKSPVADALVTATPAGARAPRAVAVSGKNGSFALEDLPAGAYALAATLDEDGDGRWRKGEPEGVVAEPVDVTAASAAGVDLRLTYGPSLSAANARLQVYAAGAGEEERGVLTVSVAARDRDLDLERVWATLPGGEEVDLADDGAPPDAAAGDSVYTYNREYRGAELAALPEGAVTVAAEDGRGNRAVVTEAQAPGLAVRKLEPPPAVVLDTGADALDVSWELVEGAWGGYVVFLVPADRRERFTGPGTGEVFSNFRNPVWSTALPIPYGSIADWWAYPARSRFLVILVASAGDGGSYEASDKALISATWYKPARE